MVFTPTVRVQASGIVVASQRMLVPFELDALCDIIMALYIYGDLNWDADATCC